ncbi:MAG TPA: TIGR03032 family protein [Lacipirellulaceae bacterium]|nr:TIGR03032 family protein [Lacipirellulaceae bacterium]
MTAAADEPSPSPDAWREVRYRHSANLPAVLRELRCSLLVSTYQAGKLLAIGTVDLPDGSTSLHFSFHNFDQAMGVAVLPSRLAVGAKGAVWLHDAAPEIARSLAPSGQFDRCYLARRAHVTGGIHCHEMAWDASGELWVVNTLFSCLATLDDAYSFVPRWRPPFISELAGEDRCHLNGLAMRDGRPALVTMMAETNVAAGWRERKESTGLVMDLPSQQAVTRGLAMPHSPRWRDGRLWVLNSGCGTLEVVDSRTGQRDVVAKLPGYTRGLAFCGPAAFVGLSRIRETSVFGGLPIAAEREALKCGVGVVDLASGRTIATLEFESGVEEIFDVQTLPETRRPAVCGPRPDQDAAQDVWLVPREDQVRAIQQQRASDAGSAPDPHALAQRALALQREGRIVEAIGLFERVCALRPHSAELWNHLGNALQDAGRQEQALAVYRRGAEAEPTYGPVLQNLGYVLVAHGRTDEGIGYLREAQSVQPADVNHVLLATAMPIVYESTDDVSARRTKMLADVAGLVERGLSIDATRTLIPTNFFAAYQGENDRELNLHLGRLYRGPDATEGRPVERPGGKLRVGFLSAYFRDHTIGRLNIGRIERLPRGEFEAVVCSVGQHDDPLAERFRKAADRFVVLPRNVAEARRLVAEERLDLLFFTDVGMDALSYTLAFSRMAPVQAATWGHPVTTGSPTMDYFLSSELLETLDGPSHYSERLLRPQSLCTYYERPRIAGPPKSRRDFGLPDGAPLYACPQTLFKFHPEFDAFLAGVLRQDPDGRLVLIEGRTAHWPRLLRERFQRVMPDVTDRMAWLKPLPNDDFLQLLALCDASLDPLHFGGGNTSYEALAVGTPVVTLPGSYLRSRISRALYAKMADGASFSETPAPIATGPAHFVELAIELAHAGPRRRATRDWLADRGPRLFEDEAEVDDFAQAISGVA